ncbi:MAG: hypothetical protein ACOC5M_03115, partial [Chloroflexota bacterium]
DDSALNHSIGCGAAAVVNPNELTLVDNGRLYEGVANGLLVDPFRATFYDVMIDALGSSNQDQGAQNIVNNIITQEAAGLGLSNATLNDFRDDVNFAFKAGSYTLNPGGQFQSIGGWADVPFLADCQPAAREYVWGVFIHGADAGSIPGSFSIWTPGLELLREQVRAALDTQAACEADLEIVSMQVLNPPADIPVNTSVPITIRKEVRNNGPADVIDATVDLTAIAPADCQVTPVQASQAVMGLAEGQLETVDEQVAIECSQPSFHTFQFDNEIAPLDPNVNDPDITNNDAFTSLEVAVIAQADLAVTGWDFSELDNAAIDAFLVEGDPFVFSTVKNVHNFGDTVGGLYSEPVDAVVSRSIEVPEGIEGSVHIGPHEAPATVTIEKPGDPPMVMGNVAAGEVIAEVGPAVITVEFAVDDLEVSVDRALDEVFDLRCLEPSQHEISFVNEIVASDQHVEDPDLSNNAVEVARTIECVTPVQINIKPGSDPNAVNPRSKGKISVAVLATDAGEYGLPVAFDATTIDPLSVRFGPADVLETGGGAFESHGMGHLEDSLEMDEQTSDGDTDVVLHFKTQETGIDATTTEACVIGSYLGPDDLLHSFFGCDAVSIRPKL